jgi:uncharacterized protein YbjT (DUF2867 family)
MKKKAILAGATGLIGGYVLQELLKDKRYAQVIVLSRKPLNIKHPKLKPLILDFDHLEKFKTRLRAQDVFCCLGTSRKKSPTPEAYRKIEFEYAFKLAQITCGNKAQTFLTISTMNADVNSSAAYLQLKGEVEEVVSALPFQAVHLFRPSFILGEKDRQERRPMEALLEKVLKPASFLFAGPLRAYRPILGTTIAHGMIQAANSGLRGVHIWESNMIEKLGN